MTELGFQRNVTTLRTDLHDWIERHRDVSDKEVSRLAGHLENYQTEFLRYLDDPWIPATNNTAEQTLRFAVLLRKVGCGNRTETRARTFEVLSSVSATFRRSGIDFLAWVSNLMHLGHPKLIPPELPAPSRIQLTDLPRPLCFMYVLRPGKHVPKFLRSTYVCLECNRPRPKGVALACPPKGGETRIGKPRWGLVRRSISLE